MLCRFTWGEANGALGAIMQSIEILGYVASVASGGAFLPQAIQTLRTRRTRDLSLPAVTLGAAGTVLWALYGLAIGSGPVTISNLVVMPFAIATLVMKLRGE
jgi:MtN3 and saliva related transmembrane protein